MLSDTVSCLTLYFLNSHLSFFLHFFDLFILAALGTEPRMSCIGGKLSTTELQFLCLKNLNVHILIVVSWP